MNIEDAEQVIRSQPRTFVAVRDCILIDDDVRAREPMVAKHLNRLHGNISAVEKLINRRHVVAHLLDPLMDTPISVSRGVSPEECEGILRAAFSYGRSLAEALDRDFPGGDFELDIEGAVYVEEEPLEVSVTFWRRR